MTRGTVIPSRWPLTGGLCADHPWKGSSGAGAVVSRPADLHRDNSAFETRRRSGGLGRL